MKKHLYKDVKLKDGTILAKGLPVEITPGSSVYGANVSTSFGTFKLLYKSVVKPPSIKALEKWEYEGYSKTIAGKRTEPDGVDENGFPSWLLALGYI